MKTSELKAPFKNAISLDNSQHNYKINCSKP